MRVFIAISIVVASVSSASAQFAMDHGRAADAAQAAPRRGLPRMPRPRPSPPARRSFPASKPISMSAAAAP